MSANVLENAATQRWTPRFDNASLLELVNARKQHSTSYHQKYFLKLARWYDLWRGIYTTRFDPYRNSIHIPFLFSVVQSDVARKVQTSFGSWPVVSFGGYAPEDAPRARKNEVLISAQMKDADSFRKAVDLFITSDLYGTGIARLGWKKERKLERFRMLNESMGREEVMDEWVTRFDGPDWQVKDPLDVWVQPGKRRFNEMDWVFDRYYLDLDMVRAAARPTDDGREPLFDPIGVAELEAAPMSQGAEGEMNTRMSVYRSYGEWEARRQEKFAKPVEIWEMWGRVPEEFAPDGITSRQIIVANGRVVLRNQPNPYWHGRLPFYEYSPCPDPHYFHGVGKVEIGEKMQAASNRIANQKLDSLDLFVNPAFIADRALGLDTTNIVLRPGRVLTSNKPPTEEMFRALSPDLRGVESAYAEIAQQWAWIQQGTGLIEDVAMGGPGGSGRETARAAMMRNENVLTRLMLEARLAEEGFVEPLANGMVDLNKQYLPVPKQIPILGSRAIVNPITGLPLPPEPIDINLDDLNHNYHAHAVGATQMLGKSVKQQNIMMALQAVQANPVMLQLVNWVAFARQLFETLDLTNVDELLVTQIPMVNQMAQQAGMDPAVMAGALGAAGGAATQPLEQLDPQALGALTGMQPERALGELGPLHAPQMGGS